MRAQGLTGGGACLTSHGAPTLISPVQRPVVCGDPNSAWGKPMGLCFPELLTVICTERSGVRSLALHTILPSPFLSCPGSKALPDHPQNLGSSMGLTPSLHSQFEPFSQWTRSCAQVSFPPAPLFSLCASILILVRKPSSTSEPDRRCSCLPGTSRELSSVAGHD